MSTARMQGYSLGACLKTSFIEEEGLGRFGRASNVRDIIPNSPMPRGPDKILSKRTLSGNLSRAKTPEDKALVRQAFIDVGRRLFSHEQPSKVSLRRIAEEAGYSPGSIYKYFPDYYALMVAIWEVDFTTFTEQLEALAARTQDPAERVLQIMKWSVKYWLAHQDQFDVLFSRTSKLGDMPEDAPFGLSPTVRRALDVYYNSVGALFVTLCPPPMPSRLAADTLIAVSYGVVGFPQGTPTMGWSDQYSMAETAIDAIVSSWLAVGRTSGRRIAAKSSIRKGR